jgi:hypothetical protein
VAKVCGLVPIFRHGVTALACFVCEVQIRRSSGNNVVKVDDVQNRLSVSLVQTYVYNGDYAVFLNRRPMSGHGKHGASHCEQCGRGLQDEDCRFCSLECKVRHILLNSCCKIFMHACVGVARFQVFNSASMLYVEMIYGGWLMNRGNTMAICKRSSSKLCAHVCLLARYCVQLPVPQMYLLAMPCFFISFILIFHRRRYISG